MVKHKSTIFAAFALLFAVAGAGFAADDENSHVVDEIADFSEIAPLIEKNRLPLLLMFSSEYCSYCVRVENEFLIPMQISGDYQQRVMIRKLRIDFGNAVRDFDGQRIDADEFAERYNISVTPTVVFLDQYGSQLAPKLVGLMTPDFYGGYIDESIDVSLDLLRRNKPLRVTLTD